MGLLKGPLTFSRFRLNRRLPADFAKSLHQQIRKDAFQVVAGVTEEKVMGWTGLENVLDTDFEQAACIRGDYLLFSLRIDRRTVPPALLKLKVMEAEKQHLTETGKKKIEKYRREDIRDGVRLELLSRIPPVPSFYEVCWSVSTGMLLLTSLADKVLEDFQTLFKRSFMESPCPFVSWDPQVLESEIAGQVVALETSSPGSMASASLGREFLTWLWFKSEERNGMVMMPGGMELEIHFVRRLVLESGDGEYSESVVCQGLHTDLKEGREALRQGKKIREARLKISRDSADWEFTFKADRCQFQSLKLPVVMDMDEEQDNRDGRVLERIYLLETVIGTMDQLFNLFLSLRLSDAWPQEQSRMEKWLR